MELLGTSEAGFFSFLFDDAGFVVLGGGCFGECCGSEWGWRVYSVSSHK
jgi:hypothetical protein